MRRTLLISMCLAVLAGAGCGLFQKKGDPDLVYAAEAKAALVELMASGENPFPEGWEPDRVRALPLVLRAPGRYAFGPFDIDLVRRLYRAEIVSEQGVVSLYAGAFKVDAEGRWTAKWPESRRREPLPPPPPPPDETPPQP